MKYGFKLVLFVAFSLVFLIFALYAAVRDTGNNKQIAEYVEDPKTPEDCSVYTDIIKKDHCYWGVAEKSYNATVCDNIVKAASRDFCLASTAKLTRNAEACGLLSISGQIRDDCYFDVSVADRNELFCANIVDADLKDDCYAQVARSKYNTSICDKITNQDIKDKCFYYANAGYFEQKTEICVKIQAENFRSGCYTNAAMSKSDKSVCDNILNSESNEKCRQSVLQLIQNTELCAKDLPEISRDECFAKLAREKQDVGLCEPIKGRQWRDVCYLWLADFRKDIAICDNIKELDSRDRCIANLMPQPVELSDCRLIAGNVELKSWCASKIAIAKSDEMLCGHVVSRLWDRDSCYTRIADNKKDIEICKKIFSPESAAICIRNVAVARADLKICDGINLDWVKNDCKRSIK